MLQKIETLTHFVAGKGSRGACCLTLRNELSRETHVLTKQETFIGRGTWVSGSRRTAAQPAVSSFTVMWLVSRSSLASHSDSGSFLAASAWLRQDEFQRGGFWEVGRTYRLASPPSFWPFLNSSSGWQLVSSLFLTRTSCCKITHAHGYCGAWPWQEVSVSNSPNMSGEWDVLSLGWKA